MGHFRVLLEYCKNYGETGVYGPMTLNGVNGSRRWFRPTWTNWPLCTS